MKSFAILLCTVLAAPTGAFARTPCPIPLVKFAELARGNISGSEVLILFELENRNNKPVILQGVRRGKKLLVEEPYSWLEVREQTGQWQPIAPLVAGTFAPPPDRLIVSPGQRAVFGLTALHDWFRTDAHHDAKGPFRLRTQSTAECVVMSESFVLRPENFP